MYYNITIHPIDYTTVVNNEIPIYKSKLNYKLCKFLEV